MQFLVSHDVTHILPNFTKKFYKNFDFHDYDFAHRKKLKNKIDIERRSVKSKFAVFFGQYHFEYHRKCIYDNVELPKEYPLERHILVD